MIKLVGLSISGIPKEREVSLVSIEFTPESITQNSGSEAKTKRERLRQKDGNDGKKRKSHEEQTDGGALEE
jgi:hypothetical protein